MENYKFQWNLPYEIDPDESEITVEFCAIPGEAQTRDYPGSPPVVEIERVTRDGVPINPHAFKSIYKELEQAAWNYLESLFEERDA